MGSAIGRRIRRLEQRTGGRDDELVEVELAEEDKAALRDLLTGLYSPERLEAVVNDRRLVPKSHLPRLTPEDQANLEETMRKLRASRR